MLRVVGHFFKTSFTVFFYILVCFRWGRETGIVPQVLPFRGSEWIPRDIFLGLAVKYIYLGLPADTNTPSFIPFRASFLPGQILKYIPDIPGYFGVYKKVWYSFQKSPTNLFLHINAYFVFLLVLYNYHLFSNATVWLFPDFLPKWAGEVIDEHRCCQLSNTLDHGLLGTASSPLPPARITFLLLLKCCSVFTHTLLVVLQFLGK